MLKTYSGRKLLLLGVYILSISGLAMLVLSIFFQPNLVVIMCTSMGIAFSLGVIAPNTNSQALSLFTSGMGSAGALYGFLQMLIAAGISLIVTGLDPANQLSLAVVILTLSAISFAAYAVVNF